MFLSIALNLNTPWQVSLEERKCGILFVASYLKEKTGFLWREIMSALCIMKNNNLSSLATVLGTWGQRRVDSKVLLERKVVPISCHPPLAH